MSKTFHKEELTFPGDSTMDELIDELLMAASIQRGIEDSLAGRVISHEQLKKEVESWN